VSVCLASNGQISEHHRSEFPTVIRCDLEVDMAKASGTSLTV
jgi:hypothetical protein